jgi:hypothetical protein
MEFRFGRLDFELWTLDFGLWTLDFGPWTLTLDLNYFNYFSEIEDTFIRRRGKHLWLSPMDWALMEGWKDRGVPLHVALRGIERAFDSYEAKKYKRSVKTLLYCEEEVEAQYAEWLESRVGSHVEATGPQAANTPESTFPRPAVLKHLGRALDQLNQRCQNAEQDEISLALSRAARLLSEIKADYESVAQADARKLEDSLTGVERLLNDALRTNVSAEQLTAFEKEIKQQLQPYRSHMAKAVYQQTFDNLLLKRLREQHGVPRLSLFFL